MREKKQKIASIGIIALMLFGAFTVLINTGTENVKAVSDDGLVAYWDFDEGTGTVLHDKSGNGNDGTIYGNPEWVGGVKGKALSFDGVDDYVNCGTTLTENVLSEVTVEAFVHINRFPLSTDVDQVDLQGHDEIFYDGSDGEFSLSIKENKTASFSVKMSDGSWYHTSSITRLETNVWYQIVGTYNSRDAKIKIFVNGQLENTSTVPEISLYNPSGDFYPTIGAYSSISNNHRSYLNGLIDEVRIYNRALSAEEIKAQYNEIAHPPQNGGGGGSTPGFEANLMLLSIIAVAVIGYYRRRLRK